MIRMMNSGMTHHASVNQFSVELAEAETIQRSQAQL